MSEAAQKAAGLTQKAQQSAINEVYTQEIQWKSALEEYENLGKRISILPEKLNHNVMVPFGNLAFIPGKLVHTNEFMMHLGDSWFANMSAKQVLGLIERRKTLINKNIKDLNVVIENIKEKNKFVKDEFGRDVIDIKEDIPKDFILKNETKRQSRAKTQRTIVPPKGLKENELSTHKELMKRLDQLEKEELGETSSDSDDYEIETTNIQNIENTAPCTGTIKFKHSNIISDRSNDLNPGNINDLPNQKPAKETIQKNETNTAISGQVVESTNEKIPNMPEKRKVSRFKAAKQRK